MPAVADGWSIELAAEAPGILFPTAIVAAPDGTVYLGSDPMDMPGPPTAPIDRVVAIKDGKVRTFADKLWSVMGLEWVDGTLYVVHAPFLSAFRDTDGDGKADSRVDLITGLGPRLPGFNGINDHIASGIRLGMDGFLYIAVGDKGIPRGVARDGTTIQLHGGGVIRIRPDGTGLEVVSTGERNPLSVALSATDEIFTYGNDDDSKQMAQQPDPPHRRRALRLSVPVPDRPAPRPADHGRPGRRRRGHKGSATTRMGCRRNIAATCSSATGGFRRSFGSRSARPAGRSRSRDARRWSPRGRWAISGRSPWPSRPTAASFWLVDWAYNGWLDPRAKTGRLYRLRYTGPDAVQPAPRPSGRDRSSPAHGARPPGALGPPGVAADPGGDGAGGGPEASSRG